MGSVALTEDPLSLRTVALTHKESILFMQRLAALERNGIADGPIKAQYEQVFLDMLYTMCTTPRPDAPEVRDCREQVAPHLDRPAS